MINYFIMQQEISCLHLNFSGCADTAATLGVDCNCRIRAHGQF
jgi:hypothetical protein